MSVSVSMCFAVACNTIQNVSSAVSMPCWPTDLLHGTTRDASAHARSMAMVAQEEGIILKNPQSQWKPDDRSLGAWMKLKPEYTYAHEVGLHMACLL